MTTPIKRLTTLFTLLFAIGLAGSTPAVAVNSTTPDYKIDATSASNNADWWVFHFEQRGNNNVECTKYENHSGWLPGHYEAGVIKAGHTNYVWLQPDNTGRQLSDDINKDPSHVIKCSWDEPPSRSVFNPQGHLAGPCADPRVRAHMDNTQSDRTAIFKVHYRDGNNVWKKYRKEVAAGESKKSFWFWVYGRGQTIKLVVWEKWNKRPTKEVLDRVTIDGNATPWGSKGCVR